MTIDYERIYIRFKGRVLGPLSSEKAVELVRRGQITKQHELSPDGIQWRQAAEFPELFSNDSKNELKLQKVDAIVAQSKPEGWYANFNGVNEGPVDEGVLHNWIAMGKVTPDTLIWRNGMNDWLPAGSIRQNWFVKSAKSASQESSPSTQGSSDGTAVLAAEILTKSYSWILFLAIVGLMIGVCATIVSIAWFFVVATRDGAGPAKVMAVVASITQSATSVAWLLGSILLVRYSAKLSVLKYRSTERDLELALVSLNRFWTFTAVVLLVWLIVTSLIIAMIFLLGLSVPFPIAS